MPKKNAAPTSAVKELASLTRELLARIETADEIECSRLFTPSHPPMKPLAAPAAVRPSKPERPPAAAPEEDGAWESLKREVSACRKCSLGEHRIQAVFGVGSPRARVLFVGEGPGFQEDHTGEPFVGRAGQLLDKILLAIGLSRETVYIANIVKCHPMVNPSDPESRGNDRPPTPEEIAACRPYLDEQIRRISPRAIVTLGSVSTKTLLGADVQISKVRGVWRDYLVPAESRAIRLLPTYHPAALLRNPNLKRDVWTDMKNLRQWLEEAA